MRLQRPHGRRAGRARRLLRGGRHPARTRASARSCRAISNWPTIPQLFVNGELVGGCDIVTEMYESGELADTLGIEPKADAPAEAPVASEPGAPPLQIRNDLA